MSNYRARGAPAEYLLPQAGGTVMAWAAAQRRDAGRAAAPVGVEKAFLYHTGTEGPGSVTVNFKARVDKSIEELANKRYAAWDEALKSFEIEAGAAEPLVVPTLGRIGVCDGSYEVEYDGTFDTTHGPLDDPAHGSGVVTLRPLAGSESTAPFRHILHARFDKQFAAAIDAHPHSVEGCDVHALARDVILSLNNGNSGELKPMTLGGDGESLYLGGMKIGIIEWRRLCSEAEERRSVTPSTVLPGAWLVGQRYTRANGCQYVCTRVDADGGALLEDMLFGSRVKVCGESW